MELYSVDLPTMYGDHHVMEVRRILLEISGVQSVYASSSFHIVEIEYDPAQVQVEILEERLQEAGYLGELAVAQEIPQVIENGVERQFLRHTAVYEQVQSTVTFAQTVQSSRRALWPCPGIGVLHRTEEGES